MQSARKIVLASIFLASLLLSSCHRKPASSLADNDLTRRIPAGSLGFLIVDQSAAGVSPQRVSIDSIAHQLSSALPQRSFVVESTIAALSENGFLAVKHKPALTSKTLVFISPNRDGRTIDVGMYANALENTDLRPAFNAFKGALHQQGYALSPENLAGADAFSIKLDLAGMKERLYYAAAGGALAITSDPALLQALFDSAEPGNKPGLLTSEAFTTALAQNPLTGGEYSLGFLDVKGLLSAMAQRRLLRPGQAGLSGVPVQSLLFTQSNPEAPRIHLALSLVGQSEAQTKWIRALEGGGGIQAAQSLPKDTMLLAATDGKALSESAAGAPRARSPELGKALSLLSKTRAVAVAIRPPAGALPFPEVMVVCESDRPDELKRDIQAEVASRAAMLALAQPKDKDLLGEKVSVLQSPFGPGLYLAQSSKKLLAASSEAAISDLIKAAQGKSSSLSGTVDSRHQKLLSSKTSRFQMYLNFVSLAQTIANVEQSLSMFTGGKASISPGTIEQLKAWGTMSAAAEVRNGTLLIDLQTAD